jgi:Ca2+-binding RTX toxin-like protein
LDTAHPSYRLDAIEFADGTSWNPDTVMQKVLQGTEGADVINGSAADDTIDGLGGNDTIYGKSGNDTLNGGTGDDYLNGYDGNDIINGGDGTDRLYGSSGDDVLSGGAGNDTLSGDTGNDTYLFTIGNGADSISNYDLSSSSIDVLQFENISYENLWFSRSSNDLKINIVGTNDQVTISNWYINNSYQLDQIYAGSSLLSNDEVDQLVSAMSAYAVPSGEGSAIPQDTMDELGPVLTNVWL